MTLSAADRQRRSRRHRAGDHSLCDPARCPEAVDAAVTNDVTSQVTRDVTPRGLGRRGKRLWDALSVEAKFGPAELVMLEEACRMADRLDGFDRLLRGDAEDWLSLRDTRGNPERQEIVIDGLLVEARQHATALKGIVADLRQARGKDEGSDGAKGSILDELAKRRADRQQQAAGQ